MPKYWMISDRNVEADGLGVRLAARTYWTSDNDDVTNFSNWTKVTAAQFRTLLLAAADALPPAEDPAANEDQKHVTIFIHGYNNTWSDAASRYKSILQNLFSGPDGLGLCIFFTWPSHGAPADYLPDRSDAVEAAPDLADILSQFYDWLLDKQEDAASDLSKACKAKVSIIAHSMGNYVLEKAMYTAWTRKNQPLLVSLVNQLIMVAADVDNDLFKSGDAVHNTDGDAISNLCYRVTALYSGRDPILGLSAGLKHFGKRRLGRSGLDKTCPIPDNVWDIDCTSLIPPELPSSQVHSCYFEVPKIIDLMRPILRGIDRKVLTITGVAPSTDATS